MISPSATPPTQTDTDTRTQTHSPPATTSVPPHPTNSERIPRLMRVSLVLGCTYESRKPCRNFSQRAKGCGRRPAADARLP